MDKVDYNKRYLEGSEEMSWWNEQIDNFLNNVLFQLKTIPEGYIVEFGNFRCVTLNKLIGKYGADKCKGFDIVNYENHPAVTEIDVRKLDDSYNLPIAIAINDISSWQHSPQSRRSTLNFVKKNLVSGGYYVDNNIKSIPFESIASHFQLIQQYNFHTLWQKP